MTETLLVLSILSLTGLTAGTLGIVVGLRMSRTATS